MLHSITEVIGKPSITSCQSAQAQWLIQVARSLQLLRSPRSQCSLWPNLRLLSLSLVFSITLRQPSDTHFPCARDSALEWHCTLNCRTYPDPRERTLPSKKSYVCSLSDGSTIHAGPVLPAQHVTKQTTTVIVNLHTQNNPYSSLITTIVSFPTPGELTLVKLTLFATQIQACKAITTLSSLVLQTIEWCYSLQYTLRLPRYCGVVRPLVRNNDSRVFSWWSTMSK